MHETVDPMSAIPKDKGWAWMCLLGAFTIHFLLGGACANTFGVLFNEIQESFDASAKEIMWIPAIMMCFVYLTVTPANLLCKRFGARRVIFMGGLLLNIGFVFTAFLPKLWMVYISYGILVGVGGGLCYGPSIIVIGTCFQKRRALANGITFSASSLGGFCFPPLMKYCLDIYGLQGTLLIIGGLSFHITAAGILFRPPEFYEIERKLSLRQHIRCKVKISGLVTQTTDNIPVSAEIVSNTTNMDGCVVPQDYDGAKTKLDSDNRGTGGSRKISPENTQLQKVPSQWNTLKNPLLFIYALTMPISDTSFMNCILMIYPYATDIGISKFDAIFLVSIMGICSGASRFLVGIFSEFNIIKKKYIYQAATLANGIVLCLCPIVRQYVYLAIMSGLCGFFSGTAVVLAPVLIAEELGTANLPVAVGFLYSLSGGIYLGSAVLIGFLRDVTGQWNDSFFMIGSLSFVAAIINLAEPWAQRYSWKQKCDA